MLALAGCSSGDNDAPQATEGQGNSDQGTVQMSTKLKGTLYFNYAAPMKAPRVMALDLRKKRYRVATDGVHANVAGEVIAYVNFCSPLQVQLAVTDEDGFMAPLSDCVERDTISGNSLQGPAISRDGKRVAVLNNELRAEIDRKEDPYGLQAIAGGNKYSATQVFDRDGNVLAEFKDMGPAVWAKDGSLILAGRGGDVGFGIFRADKKLKKVERIDDGRLRSVVDVMDAHPKDNTVAFVFNGQLFEMPLKSGKPKRLHSHGNTLSGIAYAPDGEQIAIVSRDTLGEAIQMGGGGYPIFVYDDGDIHNIRLPFVIEGPLDWVK
ncbi:MAG: hypothetical protein AAGJ86_03175 [Pseudomonadota bacterium]